MSGETNYYVGNNGDIFIDNHREIYFITGATHSGTTTGDTELHYTGETYGGGIIIATWSGDTRGLIAAENNLGTGDTFGCDNLYMGLTSSDTFIIGRGLMNTNILATSGSNAATETLNFSLSGYTDWFLPSKNELQEIYNKRALFGSFDTTYLYMSSNEFYYYPLVTPEWSWAISFVDGSWSNLDRLDTGSIRPVRYF